MCGSFEQTAEIDATFTSPAVLEELSLVAESTGLPAAWVATAFDSLDSSVAALGDDLRDAEVALDECRDEHWAYLDE